MWSTHVACLQLGNTIEVRLLESRGLFIFHEKASVCCRLTYMDTRIWPFINLVIEGFIQAWYSGYHCCLTVRRFLVQTCWLGISCVETADFLCDCMGCLWEIWLSFT